MHRLFPLPPPVLCFAICVVMYFLPQIGQHPRFIFVIDFFIILSFLIAGLSVWQFHRHQASIDPQQLTKTTTLVTSGIFRITRNPMYLSLLFLVMAWALWLGNGLAWIGVPAFVLLMNRFQISREEIYLEKKFGEVYRQYKLEVRRWI